MEIARAMRRIEEADDTAGLRNDDRNREDQHEAYEKTLRALEQVTPVDDDEGVVVLTEWIVERIQEDGERPSSRSVRERARQFCDANDYEVGNDDWLGV